MSSEVNEKDTTRCALRAVAQSPGDRPRPAPDPELKATLDDMNRRYRVQRERIESEDNTPDAA
jgi:hypothetical protein